MLDLLYYEGFVVCQHDGSVGLVHHDRRVERRLIEIHEDLRLFALVVLIHRVHWPAPPSTRARSPGDGARPYAGV